MELNLRDHQVEVIDALRDGFRQGHQSQLLYAPTGFGKTEVAIALMKATKDKYKTAAIVLDRLVLVDQTSTRLLKYGLDHGVYQSGHYKYDPRARLQVCSAQTLERREDFPKVDLLIVDECFTGDTLISTPMGHKKINMVRCGDTVYNSLGVGTVLGVKASPANELYKLEFEDGTTIECTGSHPFFTDRGWVKANEMEIGSVSFSEQGLRLLWESISSEKDDGKWKRSSDDMLGELAKAKGLLNILLKEITEPNEQSSITPKDEGENQRNKTHAYKARRERATSALASAGTSPCTRRGMGVGSIDSDKDGSPQRNIPESLQNRRSKQKSDDRNRAGRCISWIFGKKITGCEKDRYSYFPRLVNISRVEREGATTVFNLHISGHPSYFANGKLVHNCHIARKQTTEFIKANPDIFVVGLTATPFTKGLGNIYQNVVCGATNGWLVDKSWLTPLRVFIAKEIDMTGAKKIGGEWSQDVATERGMKLTGDIVEEWVKKTHEIFGRPRKTIVFCSGVAHGADLVEQFARKGYNFVSISYKDTDDFKREAIEDFAKPDTEIQGLIATDILTRGFDVSDVMIGVSARPFSKSFSSHVQQMGRIMRPYDGKDFALWLDHSGNYLRFRDDWDSLYEDGVSDLDAKIEKAKKEPTDLEKTESKCPNCGHLWPKASDTCPACGHVRQRRNEVVSVAGEMQELAPGQRAKHEDKQGFFSELLFWAEQHTYNPYWASHKYREKFGVWPRGLMEQAQPTSVGTARWIKSKNIAWAKSRGAR